MTRVFHLPDLGEGLTEAAIVQWLVAVGDTIRLDQPIVEVETAKSIVEVPSPFAGVVAVTHGEAGHSIDVGSPLIEVEEAGAPTPTGADDAPRPVAEGEAYREEERAGSGSGNVLIGYGTSGHVASARRRKPAARGVEARPQPASGRVPVVSPIVRKLAVEGGLDLRTIPATGENGVVTRGDVLRALSVKQPSVPAMPAGVGNETVEGLAARREPLGMLRRAVSAKMSRSRAEIPEATVWVDVDVTELWALRKSMAIDGRAPSFTAIFAKYVLLALEEYPVLGGRLSADGTEIITFDGVHLGVAADTPRGLLVPVIRGAHRLSISDLDAELRRVAESARSGRAAPEELSGSTFTLNNYGSLGVDGSAAIINHPEVAILGIGRIIERPWVVDGAIVPRRIVQVSLVFDHRVCDGGYAAGFLRRITEAMEHPARMYSRI